MQLNKIYNENNLETMSRMPDGFIDLTVTSPPYDNLRTYEDNVGLQWNFKVFKPIARELFRVTKPGGVVVWVVGDATIKGSETGTSFKQALYFMTCGFNLHDTMIYQKDGQPITHNRYDQKFEFMFVFSKGSPAEYNPLKEKTKNYDKKKRTSTFRQQNGEMGTKQLTYNEMKVKTNIWKYGVGYMKSSTDKTAFEHPATFPEQLAKDHIYSWSNENDIVYDPFMGSGTTAKACIQMKRQWIGSEISEKYCELANKRLKPYIDQKAMF